MVTFQKVIWHFCFVSFSVHLIECCSIRKKASPCSQIVFIQPYNVHERNFTLQYHSWIILLLLLAFVFFAVSCRPCLILMCGRSFADSLVHYYIPERFIHTQFLTIVLKNEIVFFQLRLGRQTLLVDNFLVVLYYMGIGRTRDCYRNFSCRLVGNQHWDCSLCGLKPNQTEDGHRVDRANWIWSDPRSSNCSSSVFAPVRSRSRIE